MVKDSESCCLSIRVSALKKFLRVEGQANNLDQEVQGDTLNEPSQDLCWLLQFTSECVTVCAIL